MIKLFAWEGRTVTRISDLRETELKYIWQRRMAALAQNMVAYVVSLSY